jgi:hypothetical protein
MFSARSRQEILAWGKVSLINTIANYEIGIGSKVG